MKYIASPRSITTVFSMFNSRVSNYDIVDSTPYRKDPSEPLLDESKKQGLKLCFYYSILTGITHRLISTWPEKTRPQKRAD